MKTMKLIYPLAFAVALVATGCGSHKPIGMTPLPPGPTPPPIEPTPTTVPYTSDTNATGTALPQANPDLFQGMIEDTNALAANTVHFAYDSAAIKKSEQANLQAVASALSSDTTLKLLIAGNCDERGTEE